MKTEIIGGTLRDVSWITANLRPLDHLEAFAQVECTTTELAWFLTQTPSYVACIDGYPRMAFGYSAMAVTGVSIWAVGVEGSHRCAPAITRFFRKTLIPRLWREGIRWGEARSIASHHAAHRWMEATGAEAACRLPYYGRDGEEFILYRWLWTAFADEVKNLA